MTGKRHGAGLTPRGDRLIRERVHDPYKLRKKPAEPTVCGDCGVVFSEGRWQWTASKPSGASETTCPACKRIHDHVPAGVLELHGDFFCSHRDEILRLVSNTVDMQKNEHPMKRLMSTRDLDDGVEFEFTENHLPQDVGNAVHSAYAGNLDIHFADTGVTRAYWER